MDGNLRSMRRILPLVFLFACPGAAHPQWDESIRVCFDATDAEFVKIPDGFPDGELAVLDDIQGKYTAVGVDLDSDGNPELFFPSACGTGGCQYPVYSDRLRAVIGRVFGSPICVLRKTENGMPVLQAYSRSGAGAGTVVRQAFDGHRYRQVFSAATVGDQDESVMRAIAKAPQKRDGHR